MRIIVAVICHDRFQNIKEWVRCWHECATNDAELVVIHNIDSQIASEAYSQFCHENAVGYVPSKNIGFDIGRLQDVCLERLHGFPNDFDYLIWCTDDCLPMRKDFIHQYISRLETQNIGCVAHEMSRQVKLHVRTTGFAISKKTALKLTFPADPITTKRHCYEFEHLSRKALYEQIKAMGLQSIQIEKDLRVSPLWDSGRPGRTRLDRMKEHYSIFPLPTQSNKRVTFIAMIYNSYPEIVSSLINQTHKDWELILIHDGPSDGSVNIQGIVDAANDKRIIYMETKERKSNWGFHWRQWSLNQLKFNKLGSESDYVVVTNSDNYYCPTFCEYMIKGFEKEGVIGVYCDKMVHSYTNWEIINCRMEQGFIDSGNVMIRRDVATEVGWNDIKSHSADFYYFRDIMEKYGKENFVPVKGVLFTHN